MSDETKCPDCGLPMWLHETHRGAATGCFCPTIEDWSDGAILAFIQRFEMLCKCSEFQFSRHNINSIPWYNNRDFLYAYTSAMMFRSRLAEAEKAGIAVARQRDEQWRLAMDLQAKLSEAEKRAEKAEAERNNLVLDHQDRCDEVARLAAVAKAIQQALDQSHDREDALAAAVGECWEVAGKRWEGVIGPSSTCLRNLFEAAGLLRRMAGEAKPDKPASQDGKQAGEAGK